MSEGLAGLEVLVRRTQLESALARMVDGSVPAGWQSLRFEGRSAGTAAQLQLSVHRNGAVTTAEAPDGAFDIIVQLRKLMYRPGYGTWFSLVMNIESQGHLETLYTFDDEAGWSFRIADESYREDQEWFPRSPEHIPAWLAPKLGTGKALQ